MTTSKAKKKIFDQRYELVALIGRGKKSAIYHALFDSTPGEDVALKVLLPNKELKSLRERLRNEAQAMLMAQHPYVLKLNDFQHYTDLSYLSIEYAPLGDLKKFVDSTPEKVLNPRQAKLFFKQLVEALHFCHSVGVIHRDVKPENILVISHDEIRLADFGLAQLVENPSLAMDLQKAVGTMDYLAPEVLEGKDYGTRSDFYSLAISFYELLTGKHPFSNLPLAEILNSRKRNLKHIQELVPGIDTKFASIIMQLLENDPGKRFVHSKDLIDALSSNGVEDSEAEEDFADDDFSEMEELIADIPEDEDQEDELASLENDLREEEDTDDAFDQEVEETYSKEDDEDSDVAALENEEEDQKNQIDETTDQDEPANVDLDEDQPQGDDNTTSGNYERYHLKEKHMEASLPEESDVDSIPEGYTAPEKIIGPISEKTTSLSPQTVGTIRKNIFAGINSGEDDQPVQYPSQPVYQEPAAPKKSKPKKNRPSKEATSEQESPVFTFKPQPDPWERPARKKISKGFIFLCIAGICLAFPLYWLFNFGSLTAKTAKSEKSNPVAVSKVSEDEAQAIKGIPFSSLSPGIYSGTISGLLANQQPIRFGLIVKEKTTAVVLGINGWIPSPAIRISEDSMETASNSWILRFIQEDGSLMQGKILNLVTGDSGTWKIDSVK